jgi:WD40 repeat protein
VTADGTVRLWEVATGKNTATLRGHTEKCSDVAFSADGRALASWSRDGTIWLWAIPAARRADK